MNHHDVARNGYPVKCRRLAAIIGAVARQTADRQLVVSIRRSRKIQHDLKSLPRPSRQNVVIQIDIGCIT